MSDSSRRCMLLAEIGNECMREEHITEIEQRTTVTEMIEWVKSRDDHLEENLRGRWRFARIYLLGNEDVPSTDDRQHVLTIYAVRDKRDGDRYETILQRFISLRAARNP